MTKADQLRRLEAVLSAYGADPARWPAAYRAELETLIAGDADAAAMVAEEASFDRLLDAAPDIVPLASAQAAKDRLLARFDAETGEHSASASASGPSATVVPFAPRAAKPVAPAHARTLWREVSVMAAALLIGFFSVSQGLLEGTRLDLSQLSSDASLSASEADDVSSIALGTTGVDVSEEDLL
ncbi:MAG: hypothetical protein K2Q28_06495 [Hyphomicrobium sp.]|nr:hypothetical protein [Hyphomicrobium sp.]